MTRAELGRAGEAFAAQLLIQAGYQIVCRNYRVRGGEVDVIACNQTYLLFVEVKTRSAESLGCPAEAVNALKRKRLVSTANAYCLENPSDLQPRFDVIEVMAQSGDPLQLYANWIPNAFEAPDSYQSI